MKPPGLTWDMRVVRSTRAQDAIYEAVEAALDENMTVDQFRAEARECWEIAMREKQESDRRAWKAER